MGLLQFGKAAYDVLSSNTSSTVNNDMQVAVDYFSSAEERAFEREDNAIQRSVADMRAAGINPILGFTGAGAASSAAGASSMSARQGLGSSAMSSAAQLRAAKIAGVVSIVSNALGLASSALPGKK